MYTMFRFLHIHEEVLWSHRVLWSHLVQRHGGCSSAKGGREQRGRLAEDMGRTHGKRKASAAPAGPCPLASPQTRLRLLLMLAPKLQPGATGSYPTVHATRPRSPTPLPGGAATPSSPSDGSCHAQMTQSPVVSDDNCISLTVSRPILKASDSTFSDHNSPGRKSHLGPNAESPRRMDAHGSMDIIKATSRHEQVTGKEEVPGAG